MIRPGVQGPTRPILLETDSCKSLSRSCARVMPDHLFAVALYAIRA